VAVRIAAIQRLQPLLVTQESQKRNLTALRKSTAARTNSRANILRSSLMEPQPMLRGNGFAVSRNLNPTLVRIDALKPLGRDKNVRITFE
jgi:hypothetical protein